MMKPRTLHGCLLSMVLAVVGFSCGDSGSSGSGAAGGSGGGATSDAAQSGAQNGTGQATTGTLSTSNGSPQSGSAAATSGSGGAPDAEAVTRVTGWIGQLPYGQQDLTPDQRSQIVDAIIKSCVEFGPPGADWQKYCQAILVGAILKESSYNPMSLVTDDYATRAVSGGTANDPTVGLLQIRFSSTVNDYNTYGPVSSMAAIGCSFPDFGHATENGDSDFWAISGPSANLAFMQSIPCNVGLATWYYFINATGNGGSTPVYAYQYCQGQGVAGDVIIGLLSHLQGPSGPHPPDPSNPYVTFIKGWFTTFLGTITPDPFTQSLSPVTAQYCRSP